METEKLEIYSRKTNSAIVRMPERKFPGVVIQGDILSNMFNIAMKIIENMEQGNRENAFFWAVQHAKMLEAHILHYENVLSEHGLRLPYHRDNERSAAAYGDKIRNIRNT